MQNWNGTLLLSDFWFSSRHIFVNPSFYWKQFELDWIHSSRSYSPSLKTSHGFVCLLVKGRECPIKAVFTWNFCGFAASSQVFTITCKHVYDTPPFQHAKMKCENLHRHNDLTARSAEFHAKVCRKERGPLAC